MLSDLCFETLQFHSLNQKCVVRMKSIALKETCMEVVLPNTSARCPTHNLVVIALNTIGTILHIPKCLYVGAMPVHGTQYWIIIVS